MLQKTLSVFLFLRIILIASANENDENPPHAASNTSGEEELDDNAQQPNAVGGKGEQLNAIVDENDQLNASVDDNKQQSGGQPNDYGAENVQLSEKMEVTKLDSYENIQELKQKGKPISGKKGWGKKGRGKKERGKKEQGKKGRGKNKRGKKPSSWKFKYAVDKKGEPGFDLTPGEMKDLKIWKYGIIPYYIDVVSFSDKVLRDKIRNFLQMTNSVTSINFVELPGPPANDNERWVFFMNRRGLLGCADHSVKNFTNQGVQQVVLGYDCISTRGEIAEAVMSIIGVPAQHNAPDRDKYIQVNFENIMTDKKHLFQKLNDNEWLFHDLAYDFNSVTHYDMHKYSANGRATIELTKNSEELNPAATFSATDLVKIKMLYNFITKHKKMRTPVCKKLFKISSKFKPGPSTLKLIKPRMKPSRYSGLAGPTDKEFYEKSEEKNYSNADKDQNEDNKDEITTGKDEQPDKDGENENKDVKNANNEYYEDTNIDPAKPNEKEKSSKNLLKGRGKRKKGLKGINKNKTVDILHHLSDYNSDEENH